jgi:hypothetical protein
LLVLKLQQTIHQRPTTNDQRPMIGPM